MSPAYHFYRQTLRVIERLTHHSANSLVYKSASDAVSVYQTFNNLHNVIDSELNVVKRAYLEDAFLLEKAKYSLLFEKSSPETIRLHSLDKKYFASDTILCLYPNTRLVRSRWNWDKWLRRHSYAISPEGTIDVIDEKRQHHILFRLNSEVVSKELQLFTYSLLQTLTIPMSIGGLSQVLSIKFSAYQQSDREIVDNAIQKQLNELVGLGIIGILDHEQAFAVRFFLSELFDVYSLEDRKTVDHHLRTIEKLASRGKCRSFKEVVDILREQIAIPQSNEGKRNCMAYYFMYSPEAVDFRTKIRYRRSLQERLVELAHRHPLLIVISVLFIAIGMALPILHFQGVMVKTGPWLVIMALSLLTLVIFDHLLDWLYRFAHSFFPEKFIPQFRSDIKDLHSDVLVTIPTLFSSRKDAVQQVQRMIALAKVHQNNPKIKFVLLSDFTDATQKETEQDNALINAVKDEVELYCKNSGLEHKVFVLHRRRIWNPKENLWMGWERKRGKIEELVNAISSSIDNTSFEYLIGDFQGYLKQNCIQYLMVLDEDSCMTLNTVDDLIRTEMHPLNSAIIDQDNGSVVDGYTFIQPLLKSIVSPQKASYWARVKYPQKYGPVTWTFTKCKFHQNVLGQGRFVGKGLINVKAYASSISGAFPENMVLSHDVLEGYYGGVLQVFDTYLVEEDPTRCLTEMSRSHRWARGDWQNMAWLLPHVKTVHGTIILNPTSTAGKLELALSMYIWLAYPIRLLFLLLAWTFLPGSAVIWTIVALTTRISVLRWIRILLFVVYMPIGTAISILWSWTARSSSDAVNLQAGIILITEAFKRSIELLGQFGHSLRSFLVSIVQLPDFALQYTDAIIRSVWRMYINKQGLLQWNSARLSEIASNTTLALYFKRFYFSSVWGVMTVTLTGLLQPSSLPVTIPICLLWTFSFLIIWGIDRIPSRR